LVVAELDPILGKRFREPTELESIAVQDASTALASEPPFTSLVPAIPDEQIPLNNGATIRPQLYGAKSYGDLMCDRQTLSFIRLARAINEVAVELTDAGVSPEYARALCGYAGATLVRMLRYSTRGAWLRARDKGTVEVAGIFVNESSISFSHDFFEAGIWDGPGTWASLASSTITTLASLLKDANGRPAEVRHGSAADAPYGDNAMTVVVTDPPYDSMVYYTDSSDFFFSWLKRALHMTHPEMTVTADPRGLQDKSDEIVVKEHGISPDEHRNRQHYDSRIALAFSEMRRVVRTDGIVAIVFGHGEPEVWQRLLDAIQQAGLVMTGSWPANTESGGQQGKANIQTTLTMACRPATGDRPEGRKAAVEAAIKAEIKDRYADWERWGLAPTDMLMAAAGPAMEVVGRYSVVLDARAEPVDISTFLPLARSAVQEAMALEIDHHPLETFDARTRFALWWVRLYGRDLAPKSELRWQALAASLDLSDVRDLIPDVDKGCRFTTASQFKAPMNHESAVIDVALSMAYAQEDGLHAVGEVLLASGRDTEDAYLWAAMSFLADRLPDSDPDAIGWTRILRNRSGVSSAARSVVVERAAADTQRLTDESQLKLL
jgi:putative DNA methylase